MGFPEHRRTMTDLAFATFGEDASWTGYPAPVRVRIGTLDAEQRFGSVLVTRATTVLMVRSWQVVTPVKGDRITLPDARIYEINDRPLRDARGVWRCPVVAV